jgi:hypothetical protein
MTKKASEKMKGASGSPDVTTSDATAESLGAGEVQAKMDEEQEKGYRGTKGDPTPNENYTVAGVTKGLPTPETDPAQAAKVGSGKFAHLNKEEGE